MKQISIISISLLQLFFSGCKAKSFEEVKQEHQDNVKKMGASRSNEEKIKIMEKDIEMMEKFMKSGDPENVGNNHTYFTELRGFEAFDYSTIGFCKNSFKDYAGAISGYTQAIDLIKVGTSLTDNEKGDYLYNRGKAKFNLGGNGCDDFLEAVENVERGSVTMHLLNQEIELHKCN